MSVICSKNGKSSIFIIWEKGSSCPDILNESLHREWLQGRGGDEAGYSHAIFEATKSAILNYQKEFGGHE